MIKEVYSEKYFKNYNKLESLKLLGEMIGGLSERMQLLDKIMRLENNGKVKCVYDYRSQIDDAKPFIETLYSYLGGGFNRFEGSILIFYI